jgi:hypothetical protein
MRSKPMRRAILLQILPLLAHVLRSTLIMSLAMGALLTLVMHLFVRRGLLSGFLITMAGVFLLFWYIRWACCAVLQPVRDAPPPGPPAGAGSLSGDQAD